MFLPELGKQIQGERHLISNNRIIQIIAGSNKRESTVIATYTGKGNYSGQERPTLKRKKL